MELREKIIDAICVGDLAADEIADRILAIPEIAEALKVREMAGDAGWQYFKETVGLNA